MKGRIILLIVLFIVIVIISGGVIYLLKPKANPKNNTPIPTASIKTVGNLSGQQLFNEFGRQIGDVLLSSDNSKYRLEFVNKSSLLKLLFDWKLFDRGYNVPYGTSNIPVNKVLIVLTDKTQPTFVRKDKANKYLASSSIKIHDGEIDVFVNLSSISMKDSDLIFEEQALKTLFAINYELLVDDSPHKKINDELQKYLKKEELQGKSFIRILPAKQ